MGQQTMNRTVTHDGIVAVLSVHQARISIDREPFELAIYAHCPCGWRTGNERLPNSASDDAPERVILRYAMYHHIAEIILTEGAISHAA